MAMESAGANTLRALTHPEGTPESQERLIQAYLEYVFAMNAAVGIHGSNEEEVKEAMRATLRTAAETFRRHDSEGPSEDIFAEMHKQTFEDTFEGDR